MSKVSLSPAPSQPRTGLPVNVADALQAPVDDGGLVGLALQRLLRPAVAHELPARLEHGLGDPRVHIDHAGVDGGRCRELASRERVENARKARAHAVFDPGEVRHVGDLLVAVRAGDQLARHRLIERPILDIDDDVHDQGLSGLRRRQAPAVGRHLVGHARVRRHRCSSCCPKWIIEPCWGRSGPYGGGGRSVSWAAAS